MTLPSWKSVVAALFLVTGGTALTQVDTSIKKLIDGWFTACRIIIGQDAAQSMGTDGFTIRVHTYTTGDAPKSLRVGFSTIEPIIKSVQLVRDTTGTNLAIHPDSGFACPGLLCAEEAVATPKNSGRHQDIKVKLDPYNGVFDLTFDVVLNTAGGKPPTAGTLQAYIHYPKPLPQPVCAVEKQSIFNGLVWMSPPWKFCVLAGMFLLLTAMVAIARKLT